MTSTLRDLRSLEIAAGRDDIFWRKVRKSEGCWTWNAATNDSGYGKLHYGRRFLVAHRCSYAGKHGRIEQGLWVLHRCDNPPCVNPGHLFLGTSLDNVRDMDLKGRRVVAAVHGDRHPGSKVADKQVEQMRHRFSKGESVAELALHFALSVPEVSKILRGVARRRSGGPVVHSTLRGWTSRQRLNTPRPGELNSAAKLSDDDIRNIRRMRTAGASQQSIAQKFSISRSNVGLILQRKTWKHITD